MRSGWRWNNGVSVGTRTNAVDVDAVARHLARQRLRKGDQPTFGGGINRLAGAADATGVARYVDDFAGARRDHRRQYRPRQPDRTHQIDRDQAIPHLRGVIEKRLDRIPAGGIDEPVDGLDLSVHRSDEIVDRRGAGQIERQEFDCEPCRRTFGRRRPAAFFVDVADKDPGALARQQQRCRPADAGCAAGNDDAAACELHPNCPREVTPRLREWRAFPREQPSVSSHAERLRLGFARSRLDPAIRG